MANDTAVTNRFADGHMEYESGRKHFTCDGVGCVTMWGGRDGNNLAAHLQQSVDSHKHTIEDLAHLTNRYLVEDYRPHETEMDDCGYHVGGFTSAGEPRLYHIFWNLPGSPAARDNQGAYSFQHHHPSALETRFLFNGRNDLLQYVLWPILNEIDQGQSGRFRPDLEGRVRAAHFALRFGAEITREVSPPFLLHLINRRGKVVSRHFAALVPITDAEVIDLVAEAGLDPATT